MRRAAEAKQQGAWHLARDLAGEAPPTPKTPAAKRKAENAPTPASKKQTVDPDEKEKERTRDLHESVGAQYMSNLAKLFAKRDGAKPNLTAAQRLLVALIAPKFEQKEHGKGVSFHLSKALGIHRDTLREISKDRDDIIDTLLAGDE
eukprot:gene15873-12320_t